MHMNAVSLYNGNYNLKYFSRWVIDCLLFMNCGRMYVLWRDLFVHIFRQIKLRKEKQIKKLSIKLHFNTTLVLASQVFVLALYLNFRKNKFVLQFSVNIMTFDGKIQQSNASLCFITSVHPRCVHSKNRVEKINYLLWAFLTFSIPYDKAVNAL